MLTITPDNEAQVEYDHSPDVCPQCHHALNPKILKGSLSGELVKNDTRLEIAFKCTNLSCQSMFIGQYRRTKRDKHSGKPQGEFTFQKAVPLAYKPPDIIPEVAEMSPSFRTIYEQACAAESHGLDEISGVGYRKALEFLIKDFCIHRNAEDKDEIKSSSLSVVINKYVDDFNLKNCAQRAAWLGNDETHYVRKWEDKDIKDLKILINLSCIWVQSNILTEKYLEEMQ